MSCGSLLLGQREVDVLYRLTLAVCSSLKELGAPHILIAGSLLGSQRSSSLLFNDDDVDIALIQQNDEEYDDTLNALSQLLKPKGMFLKKRATVFCDRVRSRELTHCWIDIFRLKKFENMEEIQSLVRLKDNGRPQPPEYVQRITQSFVSAPFPLYHYDTRKGIELWPREFFMEHELFPINPTSLTFGGQILSGPADPMSYLTRAFGHDCLHVYPNPHKSSHLYVKEFRMRLEESTRQGLAPQPSDGDMLPLSSKHYLPVLPSWELACGANKILK